ncbi:MAG: sugar nucleotide-binding protein [Sulfolobaceae archaeon]|nr:sugar nucleotide-binding protein [Sulfolobaceae archaeon]
MKIAVTSENELAIEIARAFNRKSNEVEFFVVDNPSKIYAIKPDVLIHTYEIEMFESNLKPNVAWNTNTWLSINLARVASKLGAENIYFSTFMIYDGKRGYYKENNPPNPVNYYGLTKLAGEVGIVSLGNFLILRVGALFSLSYRGLLYPFIRASVRGRVLRCNTNFFLSIVNIKSLARIVRDLILNGSRGIINVGSNRVSLYDVCVYLSDIFGNDVTGVEGGYRDFSLDDWILRRGYNITLRAQEEVKKLVEEQIRYD